MIKSVEKHQEESGGWTTSRHYAVPTTDVPVHEVPAVLAQYNLLMRNHVTNLLSAQYGVVPSSVRTIDAFVVKVRLLLGVVLSDVVVCCLFFAFVEFVA
jgi:hypothetical protein